MALEKIRFNGTDEYEIYSVSIYDMDSIADDAKYLMAYIKVDDDFNYNIINDFDTLTQIDIINVDGEPRYTTKEIVKFNDARIDSNYTHMEPDKTEIVPVFIVTFKKKDKTFNTKVDELTSKVETLQKNVEDTVSQMNETVDGKITTLEESVNEKVQTVDEKVQAYDVSYVVAQTLAQDFDDEKALEVKSIYPQWTDCIGKEVKQGFKFLHEDILYKVIQATLTIQEQWIPGVGTESLYAVINETNAGTKEDPVPYNGNMELENGKYYIQDGVTYLCNRNTEIAVHQALSELVGIYVEVAEDTEEE